MSDCEDAIRLTGWGLYHNFILGVAAACGFAQAIALMSIPFALPIAACDTKMSEATIIALNVCLSMGMGFGGFFFGSLSDIIGRKFLIPTTLILIFGSCFSCGFSHSHIMIYVCVFLLGAGLEANARCTKIYLAEMLPMKRRGYYLVFPDLFWSSGYLLSTAMAWLITPTILEHQKTDMRLTTWRIIFGFSGSFSIMVACASALLRSSPRFLLYTKNYAEALDTLKHMFAINNSRHSDSYTLHEEDLQNCVDDYNMNQAPEPSNCTEQTRFAIKKLYNLIMQLTKKKFVTITWIFILLKLFLLIGILVANMWLSKMLHYGEKEDCFITSIDVLHLEVGRPTKIGCKFTMSTTLYLDFILISLNIFVGQITLLWLIDRVGRRILIVCGCVACGASSFALSYIKNLYLARLIISSAFMTGYSLVDSALNVVIIEAYPTAIRGTAAGGTQFFAHIASGFTKWYLQTPCQYSFIVVGALMIGAAVLSCFLPELKNRAMVE